MLIEKKLLKKVKENLDLTRDEIIKLCNYYDSDDEFLYQYFYENFSRVINWGTLDCDTQFFYNYINEKRALCTPMLEDRSDLIIGRFTISISDVVEDIDKEWTKKEWNRYGDDSNTCGPFETGNPHLRSKGYYYPYYSLEDAINGYEGVKSDLMRPAYLNLTTDYCDFSINDFLREHGEHPRELIDFMKKYEESLNQ
jgi:hypothetical protein